MTLGVMGTSPFPEQRVSVVSKLAELTAGALWDHGFIRTSAALAHSLVALVLLASIYFRPFLVCFLAKCRFLGKLGSTLLRDSYFCEVVS